MKMVQFQFSFVLIIFQIEGILQTARQKSNSSHQMQRLEKYEQIWSSYRQSLAIIPVRQDVEPFISCLPHFWPCVDGSGCIGQLQRCDGLYDCLDGSDESDSLCSPPCPVDMFICADGLQCISMFKKCDGVGVECKDGSDESEALCTPPCSVDMFACADGSRCIPERWICDLFGDYIIVKMDQMNLSPFAVFHVQLTCLLVAMARNAFISLKSVMDGLIV